MAYDTATKTFSGSAAVEIRCWCSIAIAIPKTLHEYYVRENAAKPGSVALHCPLGHSFIPGKHTEIDRLRDELARARHREEQAAAARDVAWLTVRLRDRQIAARKGQLTRLKNRVGNGVCPCCNRYFANLHRHMDKQHPEWRATDELAALDEQTPTTD